MPRRWYRRGMIALLLLAQLQLAPPPPPATGASGSIDPVAATRAYLDQLPADEKAKSDAYFEGGYWLSLWSFLWTAGVFLLLLGTGWSARMRDRAERMTRFAALQTLLYWVQFLVVTTLLFLPLSIYKDWLREHQYELYSFDCAAWGGPEVGTTASRIESSP